MIFASDVVPYTLKNFVPVHFTMFEFGIDSEWAKSPGGGITRVCTDLSLRHYKNVH